MEDKMEDKQDVKDYKKLLSKDSHLSVNPS